MTKICENVQVCRCVVNAVVKASVLRILVFDLDTRVTRSSTGQRVRLSIRALRHTSPWCPVFVGRGLVPCWRVCLTFARPLFTSKIFAKRHARPIR